MGAVNVEGMMGGLNRFLYGGGGGEVAATVAGRRAGRLGARVAGRWNAMQGIARQGGAFGVVEAMGRPVGNAALNGMMIGAAANTGMQVYGNVTSGRNAFSGIPGAAIRGAIGGGIAGGMYGIGNAFMGAPGKLARTTAGQMSKRAEAALAKRGAGFMGTGPRNWTDEERQAVHWQANARRNQLLNAQERKFSMTSQPIRPSGGGNAFAGGTSPNLRPRIRPAASNASGLPPNLRPTSAAQAQPVQAFLNRLNSQPADFWAPGIPGATSRSARMEGGVVSTMRGRDTDWWNALR